MKLIILFQWTILQLQVKTRLESTLYWYTLAAYYVGFLQTSIFKHNFRSILYIPIIHIYSGTPQICVAADKKINNPTLL